MDQVTQSFYCNYPAQKNWLKDDLLFHENRIYVFSKQVICEGCSPHESEYLAKISIIKPKMDMLEENDLFKKRHREKIDELKEFEYKTADGKIRKLDPYLIKIPNDTECQFYKRYISVPNNI